jgi:RNA polymerase sigma-54 factor
LAFGVYDQKLTQKASQSLVLSKQMQQSLKILQMQTIDLRNHIEAELETNPFLEANENDEDYSNEQKEKEVVNNLEPVTHDNKELHTEWQEESYLRYEKNYAGNDNNRDIFDTISNDNISLKEHLLTQINITIHSNSERIIAAYLTDMLDENGYLIESLEQVSNSLKISKSEIKKVLQKLYKLDPFGVYAVDLKDCIRIQLLELGLLDDQMDVVVNNLDKIAKGDIKSFCKNSGITQEELSHCMEEIKKLDPKPGRNFGKDSTRILIPDAFINFDPKGEIKVTLNAESLPKVFVNSKYFQNIILQTKGKDEKLYCTERLQNANWLIRAVQQRSETILKVAMEIANQQYDFFRRGVSCLKPMTLSVIAKKVGMHESTISRISNKVLSTPMGTYEIKYFFNTALTSNISENMVSTTAVKQKLKELVEHEKPTAVLSDDDIAKLLNESGINISRRTIAKYRDQLHIPPSNQRKRLKSVSSL